MVKTYPSAILILFGLLMIMACSGPTTHRLYVKEVSSLEGEETTIPDTGVRIKVISIDQAEKRCKLQVTGPTGTQIVEEKEEEFAATFSTGQEGILVKVVRPTEVVLELRKCSSFSPELYPTDKTWKC